MKEEQSQNGNIEISSQSPNVIRRKNREALIQTLTAAHNLAIEGLALNNKDGRMDAEDFWKAHRCRKVTYDIFNETFIPGDQFNIDKELQKIQLIGFYRLFNEYIVSNQDLTKQQVTKKQKLQACWRFIFLNSCWAMRDQKKAICLSMDKNDYNTTGRYHSDYWSYSELQDVTNRSVREGYFKKFPGKQRKEGESYITRFEINEAFINLLENHELQHLEGNKEKSTISLSAVDIVQRMVIPKPLKPLISIKHDDGRRTEPKRGNRAVSQMFNRVQRYNEFMSNQQILIGFDLYPPKNDRVKREKYYEHFNTILNKIYQGELEIVNPEVILNFTNRSIKVNKLQQFLSPIPNFQISHPTNLLHNTHHNTHQLYPFKNRKIANDINYIQVPNDGLLYLLQINYRCYRVFNNTIKNGGRFYGIVYQALPNNIRLNTLINGEQVAELDYKSLHPSLLYSFVGVQPPESIYVYEKVAQDNYARDLMKISALVIFNAKNEEKALKAIRKKYYKKHRVMLTNTEFLKPFMEIFFEANPQLQQFSFRGMGGELQYLDSCIMDFILSALMRLNVPAIPIHDSIIVPIGSVRDAHKVMIDAYQKATKTEHLPHILIETKEGEKKLSDFPVNSN